MKLERKFDLHRIIQKNIETGMTPFKPGEITMTMFDDWALTKRVQIDISSLPNNPLVIVIYPEWQLDARNLAFQVGSIAAKHYSSIPALPVSDNVILGEN